ncbi:MAG: DUF1624 domain-containing protein [Lachnospiraceae bacterium]|nr:DUF1624 domain-containing protein [Lachnospiraceae bacterium]
MKNRLQLPDTIRGIVLVSMIIYHASWNLVYIYNVKWEWYHSRGAYLWQQSICWTFILLSGFCFSLGRRHLKNGLVVFGSGALVTAATLLFMPQNRVVFGVLTCIGSCILILTVTEKLWKKVRAEGGIIVSFLLFLLTKNINSGYLGIADIKVVEIPTEWFSNYLTAYLGFPSRGFYSTDYFSLFPWLFLFMTGFYLYQIFMKREILKKKFMEKGIPVFSFLGKHSLLIYLLHQPVIYGVQEMIFK